jgi:hypothetical protein
MCYAFVGLDNKLSRQSFEKYINFNFYENPSSVSPVVPCGRTDIQTDRQTEVTKQIVAFRNCANAPKKGS